jgi:hypothetical protein
MYQGPSQTERGVRYMSNAILTLLVIQILVDGVTWASFPALAVYITTQVATVGVLAFTAAICGALLFMAAALFVGSQGVAALHRGRYEFSPEHARNVDRAMLVLGLGFVLSVLSSSYGSVAKVLGSVGSAAAFSRPRLPAS